MPRIPSAAGNLERRKETSEIKPPRPAERQIRAQPLCIPSAGHLRQMSHRAPAIFIRGPPIAGTERAPQPCGTVPRGLGRAWTPKGGLCSPRPRRCHCHLQEEALAPCSPWDALPCSGKSPAPFWGQPQGGRWGTAAPTCSPRRQAGSALSPGVICVCMALP